MDDHCAMVRAQFLFRFTKASGQPVEANLGSNFILHLKDGTPQIVMHIEDEYLQAAMQRLG